MARGLGMRVTSALPPVGDYTLPRRLHPESIVRNLTSVKGGSTTVHAFPRKTDRMFSIAHVRGMVGAAGVRIVTGVPYTAFLTKPFDLDTLFALVARLLRAPLGE